jgi:chromosome segregation ATPase
MRLLGTLAAALLGVLIWAKVTETYATQWFFVIACVAAGLIGFAIAEFLFSMRLKALETDNRQLKKGMTVLENEVNQVRKNRLENSNSNVAALENYNKQLAQLQAENQQLEAERRQQRDRSAKMKEELVKLQGAQDEKNKVQQALDDARQTIAELTNDNERLRLDLQMIQAEIAPKVEAKTEEEAAAFLVESLTTDAPAPVQHISEKVTEVVTDTQKPLTEGVVSAQNTVSAVGDSVVADIESNFERSLEKASLAAVTDDDDDEQDAPITDLDWKNVTIDPIRKDGIDS